MKADFQKTRMRCQTALSHNWHNSWAWRKKNLEQYDWIGRRSSEHRKDIREFMGFRPITIADKNELRVWLLDEILPDEHRPVYLEERVYARLRELDIEPPSTGRVKRLITSAIYHWSNDIKRTKTGGSVVQPLILQ